MANKKKTEITIHSSAAEYLTFVAATGDSENSYEMRYEDENIWLTQKMMAALYDVSVAAISQHIKCVYEDGELMTEATIKKYLTVQSEGTRQVSRNLDHYNLRVIIAVVERADAKKEHMGLYSCDYRSKNLGEDQMYTICSGVQVLLLDNADLYLTPALLKRLQEVDYIVISMKRLFGFDLASATSCLARYDNMHLTLEEF